MPDSFSFSKYIVLTCAALFINHAGFSSDCNNAEIYKHLKTAESNNSLTDQQKLVFLLSLKIKLDGCNVARDSVYSIILEKIGSYESLINKNYSAAINYTLHAVRINSQIAGESYRFLAIGNYFRLARYYDEMTLFSNALAYYDTTIFVAQNYSHARDLFLDARLYKAYIFFRSGDYQKGIEESVLGMHACSEIKDSLNYLYFLNQKAQCLFFQNNLSGALSDVTFAKRLALNLAKPFQLASAYKMEGYIYAKKRQFLIAIESFKKCIRTRIQTNNFGQIAGDFNDFGNFYRDSLRDYSMADIQFKQALKYAYKISDSVRLARIYVNLGRNDFYKLDYKRAQQDYLKAEQFLKIKLDQDFLSKVNSEKIIAIGNKELVLALFNSKTEFLVSFYKHTGSVKYLKAALQTALLFDTITTQIRHEQLGEQSKLYWRNRTRDFFTNALEASYLSNRPELALFFMEKSRAVLLNDKLNELGAKAYLPQNEVLKQQKFQIKIITEQQKLDVLPNNSEKYKKQQQIFYQAKSDFEHYINSLEQKYPQYYQYKYAENVPSLSSLQQYLSVNHKSFIHYFINDTIAFILGITSAKTQFIKLSGNSFNSNKIKDFLKFCADKDSLNKNFSSFISLSNSVYKLLFKPLTIAKGSVIICPDNFLIPFEALCTNSAKNNFLINDYAFSYVYSASYLLKKFNPKKAEGDFIGFAPVTFQSYLHVPDLSQSVVSLKKCASFYRNTDLFINENATRFNFLNSIGSYNIVSIFSHANADTTDTEPFLYMNDSIIKLSELQGLQKSAASLVILSACETDVGKNAPGEGIYSLARGFSAAGIPSVAATLWKADEQAIYYITESFHDYLSKGFPKDEALQKAKLFYIHKGNKENLLPYYWANLIVAGNADPVKLPANAENNKNVSGKKSINFIALIFLLLILFLILHKLRR